MNYQKTSSYNQVEHAVYPDPIAASLADFWRSRREEIGRMVERAEQLSLVLQNREVSFVGCHSDLHGRNVLALEC